MTSVDRPQRDTHRRTAAWRRGRRAEVVAVVLLYVKFYRVLARRWRPAGRVSGAGEIDIVARRGRCLAVIEVKTRGDDAAIADAVTVRQRRRIAKSATLFVQRHPRHANCDIRFDAILVRRFRWPKHLTGAWRADA